MHNPLGVHPIQTGLTPNNDITSNKPFTRVSKRVIGAHGKRNLESVVHHNAATRNAAMHNAIFSHRNSYPFFLQRHRCDALPCFSASPVIIDYIAHIAFPPLLPYFLSPQWFTVQNKKKFTKSHNSAMSPLATRDGHRKRKKKRCGALSWRGLGRKGWRKVGKGLAKGWRRAPTFAIPESPV